MKRAALFLIVLVLAGGCGTGLERLRVENQQNLLTLSVGMTKKEAMDAMGYKTASNDYIGRAYYTSKSALSATNPYRSEIMQGKDKIFEVLYYYTDVKSDDGAITDDELTPLIFDEGRLIGWGWGFLNANVQKYEIRLR
ncbi:MAG TPA: DUF3192 domain-containing protein [Planctomycetes bacterium]|nr:DUF3192 domain-containing protein [Planctomycetota bacterium]